jgi:catechol 2,3-dioxygenase-like lactoylglutathione lyase family enzyme
MRMIPIVLFLAACLAGSLLAAQEKPSRPRITGIDHVRVYVSNLDKSREFYSNILGLLSADYRCSGPSRSCFAVRWAPKQHVELEQAPSSAPKNWLAEVAFTTENVPQMRRYLLAHGIKVGAISKGADYTEHFELRDPGGNPISFVGYPGLIPIDDPPPLHAVGERLIHAGFVVENLTAENHFYIDLLGFRLYWHGGFKDQDTDWYEIQVPDGDNWIEYMLNIPANADHKELGVQNHFSLGVKDAQAAAAQLRKNGLQTFDGPEIGRDGKNSLDAYDPDGTRIEVMEFTPAKPPCCHPYTAEHPKP